MRDLILKRIEELRHDTRYNAFRIFGKNEYYASDMDFSKLSDDDLVKAFEIVVSKAYRLFG